MSIGIIVAGTRAIATAWKKTQEAAHAVLQRLLERIAKLLGIDPLKAGIAATPHADTLSFANTEPVNNVEEYDKSSNNPSPTQGPERTCGKIEPTRSNGRLLDATASTASQTRTFIATLTSVPKQEAVQIGAAITEFVDKNNLAFLNEINNELGLAMTDVHATSIAVTAGEGFAASSNVLTSRGGTIAPGAAIAVVTSAVAGVTAIFSRKDF